MIEFVNVSKCYPLDNTKRDSIKDIFSFKKNKRKKTDFISLDNISFKISRGECLGILGRNGAGKSTILKLISKVTLPSQGQIILEGSVSSLLEVGAGFHMDLSGLDNIFLSGAILGLSKTDVKERLDDILTFSELGCFINEPVKHYSSGMMLRLAFSIGISLDSDILVIDEALSVGDAEFRKKCLNKIHAIISTGRTVIFVSHDTDQVRNICSSAIYIKSGKLMYQGDVDHAIKLYNQS